MKKLLLSTFAAIALTASAFSFTADAAEKRHVRVGTEGAYAPFNYYDENGELVGFDIDIAKALCEAANFECEFIAQEWSGIIPGLLAEKYDVIIASMSITEERKQKVDFTDKYYNTPGRAMVPKSSDIEISREGLEGKVLGVQTATTHANFVRDTFGDIAEVREYESQEQANLDLTSGRLDAVFADATVLDEGFLSTDDGKDYEFRGPNFNDPEYFGHGAGIAVRKGEDDLREAFNKAIKQIREDGTYEKIQAKYFDYDVYGD